MRLPLLGLASSVFRSHLRKQYTESIASRLGVLQVLPEITMTRLIEMSTGGHSAIGETTDQVVAKRSKRLSIALHV